MMHPCQCSTELYQLQYFLKDVFKNISTFRVVCYWFHSPYPTVLPIINWNVNSPYAEKLVKKSSWFSIQEYTFQKYNGEIQYNMERGWAYTVHRNMSVLLVGVLTSSCSWLIYKKYFFFLVRYINFLYIVFLKHYTVFKMSLGLLLHTFLIYV
jgi:hypothetical protein